jgi:hypothetical protein
MIKNYLKCNAIREKNNFRLGNCLVSYLLTYLEKHVFSWVLLGQTKGMLRSLNQ